jgi:Protein of unknown function (DUF3309)
VGSVRKGTADRAEGRYRRFNHDAFPRRAGGYDMSTILIVLAVLILLGAIPAWPHSRNWGYGPSGGLGLVLVIILILSLTGRI